MFDVAALGELLIDFTCTATDAAGYPTMAAHPGGISSLPTPEEAEAAQQTIRAAMAAEPTR